MASVNKVILVGNVGRDPEVKFFPSGDPCATFSLATTESWKKKSGEKAEKTEWHRVEVTGKTADVVQQYVVKGQQVYVEGQISYEEWTDKDGNKRNMTKIKIGPYNGRLVLLGKGGGGTQKAQVVETTSGPVEVGGTDGDDIPF
jgi:single-strand DNA-binding protein